MIRVVAGHPVVVAGVFAQLYCVFELLQQNGRTRAVGYDVRHRLGDEAPLDTKFVQAFVTGIGDDVQIHDVVDQSHVYVGLERLVQHEQDLPPREDGS